MRKLLLLLIPLLVFAQGVNQATVRHILSKLRSYEFSEFHVYYLDADSAIVVYVRSDSAVFDYMVADSININHIVVNAHIWGDSAYFNHVVITQLEADMLVDDVDITGIEKVEADTLIATNYLLASGKTDLAGDLKVEGRGLTNVLFVNLTTDRVGVLTATPQARLDVRGSAFFAFVEGYHLNGDSIVVGIDTIIPTATQHYAFTDTSGGDTLKVFLNGGWGVK